MVRLAPLNPKTELGVVLKGDLAALPRLDEPGGVMMLDAADMHQQTRQNVGDFQKRKEKSSRSKKQQQRGRRLNVRQSTTKTGVLSNGGTKEKAREGQNMEDGYISRVPYRARIRRAGEFEDNKSRWHQSSPPVLCPVLCAAD